MQITFMSIHDKRIIIFCKKKTTDENKHQLSDKSDVFDAHKCIIINQK